MPRPGSDPHHSHSCIIAGSLPDLTFLSFYPFKPSHPIYANTLEGEGFLFWTQVSGRNADKCIKDWVCCIRSCAGVSPRPGQSSFRTDISFTDNKEGMTMETAAMETTV